MAVILKIFHW